MLAGPAVRIVFVFAGLANATPDDKAPSVESKPAAPATPPGLGVAPPAIAGESPLPPTPTPREAEASKDAASPAAIQPAQTDPIKARAEAESRIKEIEASKEAERTPVQKALAELWRERLKWLEEWDRTDRAVAATETPKVSPEAEANDRRADFERSKVQLDRLKHDPASTLPESFRTQGSAIDDAKLAEMREAIDAARAVLKSKADEAERVRGEPAARATLLANLKVDRDKIQARIASIPARRAEHEAAFFKATNEEGHAVARERIVNLHWDATVEGLRLRHIEALIALEGRRTKTSEVASLASEAGLAVAKLGLATLEERYRIVAERHKLELDHAAELARSRAATIEDPVEKFKARRSAELLKLEAQIVEDQKSLAAKPSIDEKEQQKLADEAEKEFADLQSLIKENRVGGIAALRLNNDFRRISREQTLILRTDLAQSSATNAYYENALTDAELSYFNDARDDRMERDAFIDSLPKGRRAAVEEEIDKVEAEHKRLLVTHRSVLRELLARAERTHRQVSRRLGILDKEYTFIRTNIFWVRDSEPIRPETVALARKDAGRLLQAGFRLAADPFDRSLWSPISVEFALGVLALIIAPPAIIRARRHCRAALCEI